MTILIIIVLALIAIILYLYFHKKREAITGHKPYVEALIALLDNDEELAMKKFKEAVTIDSNLFDAYIRLGNLYRKKGDVSRAIQIHQSLTVRPILKKQDEKRVYYALTQDALEANRPNKAVAFLKEILKIDKNDTLALASIIRIYEDMESYGDCISVYEEGKLAHKDEGRRAFYYASLANRRLKNMADANHEEEKEIMNLFKKSLKISADSLSGLYYMANFFEVKGELKKARECYLKIINQKPEHAFLIIPKFEKVSFELGAFNDIITIYEKIFVRNPKNFCIGLALADLYEKKNDLEKAREIYAKLSEIFPRSILPKLRMIKLMTEDVKMSDAIAEIEKAVSGHEYICSNCGNTVTNFSFICRKCHAIESFLPTL